MSGLALEPCMFMSLSLTLLMRNACNYPYFTTEKTKGPRSNLYKGKDPGRNGIRTWQDSLDHTRRIRVEIGTTRAETRLMSLGPYQLLVHGQLYKDTLGQRAWSSRPGSVYCTCCVTQVGLFTTQVGFTFLLHKSGTITSPL